MPGRGSARLNVPGAVPGVAPDAATRTAAHAAVPDDGMSLWDLFGGRGIQDPNRFADGFMLVPWVKPGDQPPHSVKHSIKCFNQPVSYRNPAALALPVTYVAFVPKDQSVETREAQDRSWQRAKARGWSFRTFPGRANLWLQRAALFTLGAAILLAVVETIRWFAGAR